MKYILQWCFITLENVVYVGLNFAVFTTLKDPILSFMFQMFGKSLQHFKSVLMLSDLKCFELFSNITLQLNELSTIEVYMQLFPLTQWCHMALEILVKTGSGNGLLPDGTKTLPEPMLTYHQLRSCDIHLKTLSWEDLKIPISKARLKITFLKSH